MAKHRWIQNVTASIKRRGTAGKCTPITKPGCTGRARALALTFKKMAKRKKKQDGGEFDLENLQNINDWEDFIMSDEGKELAQSEGMTQKDFLESYPTEDS